VKISVIIGYYKNIPFLNLILKNLMFQTYKNFEVIVAEDANDTDIIEYLKNNAFNFDIKHVYQQDSGFRKCKILNEAIKIATGNYVVFLDGDCIPHSKLLENYNKFSELGICYGRRVMLSESMTKSLIKNPNTKINWIGLLTSGSQQLKHAFYCKFRKPSIEKNKGIWGCNWGIPLKVLKEVNGFDEDYKTAGIGEDVDIEWRLKKLGHRLFYLKHLSIVYHLNHKVHYNSEIVSIGQEQLRLKTEEGNTFCTNGLIKIA